MLRWRVAYNRARREEGFTIVELVVVLGILFVVLVGLAYTVTQGLLDVGLARQRITASGLGNGMIEQVRALPYDTVRLGLNTTDPKFQAEVADPQGRIKDCGGAYRFDDCATGEVVAIHSSAAVSNVLVPHVETVQPDPNRATNLTRRVYVTRVAETATRAESFRVTVTVDTCQTLVNGDCPVGDNSGSLRTGARAGLQLQTIIYSPTGCLSTATHPFAAPCEPFYLSTGLVPAGSVGVAGTISPLSVTDATILLPEAQSSVQLEQTRRASGAIVSPTVNVADADNRPSQGGASANSTADDDVGTGGAGDWEQDTLSGGAPSVTSQVAGTSLRASITSGSLQGSTTSTVSALPPDRSCPKSPPASVPASQTDSQPCAYSITPETGGYEMVLQLPILPFDLPLVRVVPGTQPSSFSDHTKTTTQQRSATTVRRDFASIDLVALPPTLGGSALSMSQVQSAAQATVGQSAPEPVAQNTSGTVSFFNNSLVSTTTLSTVQSTIPVSRTLEIPGVATISFTGTFTLGGATTDCVPDPCASGAADRTEAEARVASPLSGSMDLIIRDLTGTELVNVTITVDLGEVVARGTYRPAPT